MPQRKDNNERVQEFVRIAVLVWSASLLTAQYFGVVRADPTFIASVFSGSLAWYGIQKKDQRDKPTQIVQNRTRKAPSITKPKP